jgi:hypothetical protein
LIKLEQVGRLSTNFGIKAPKSQKQKTLLSNLEKIKNLKPLDTQRFNKKNISSPKNGSGTPDLLPSLNISSANRLSRPRLASKNRFDDSPQDTPIKNIHFEKSYQEFFEAEKKVKQIKTEDNSSKKVGFDSDLSPDSSLVKENINAFQKKNVLTENDVIMQGPEHTFRDFRIKEVQLDNSNKESVSSKVHESGKSSLNQSQMNIEQKLALGRLFIF